MSNTVIQGGTHQDLDELIEDIEFEFTLAVAEAPVDTGRGSFQSLHKKHGLLKMVRCHAR